MASSCILLLATAGCLPSTQSTAGLSVSAEQQFASVIAKGAELNQGLTVERLPITATTKRPASPSNAFVYLVYNHTDEDIVFDRQDYNLSVYSYNMSLGTWEKVSLLTYGSRKTTILPPHLDKFDLALSKEWFVSDEDLSTIKQTEIRIYVIGKGSNSGKTYGAFFDLVLVR
jgi:hypothetical protein